LNSNGVNPCDCCEAKERASGCDNCVLHTIVTHGECYNDKCMVNHECECLLGLDDICKASTCYVDSYEYHTCGQCAHWKKKLNSYGCNVNVCDIDDDVHCDFADACEDFEER
jgi:hypothetical protein